MLPFRRTGSKRFTAALALGAALLLGGHAAAQSPAELAPADTAVFIHIDDPAEWFGDLTQGPLGDKLREQVQNSAGIGDMLAALNMNLDQFMEAYFGGDVVVLSPGAEDDAPGVIFTRTSEADRAHAIESLFLQHNGEIAGNPVYVGPDGGGFFVMMDNWVALCELNAFGYLTDLIEQDANAPRLADTEAYAYWTAQLPADRAMTALIFENSESTHALGVVRKGRGLDATYLGTSPDFAELMGLLGETTVAEFGPLPDETLAAMSFNLRIPDEQGILDGLNNLAAPKSFSKDILPKLEPPTLLFLAAVKGGEVDPPVGVDLPVAGLAFKMKDVSVAEDLKVMLDRVVMFANFAVADMNAGPIPFRSAEYNGSGYNVAEIGKPLAIGTGFEQLAPVQIVYGRVGDYYVLCTQEVYFKQCVDADAADGQMRIDVEGPAHPLAKTPVLAMTARPDGFGELLLSWVKLLEDGAPDGLDLDIDAPVAASHLNDIVQLLQQYSLLKIQVWEGEDGLVVGRAQLTPPF